MPAIPAFIKDHKKISVVLLLTAAICAAFFAYRHWEEARAAENSKLLRLFGNADVREVTAAFRTSDRIAAMYAEEGDTVTRGQKLAALDTRELELTAKKTAAQIDAQKNAVMRLKNGTRPEETAQYLARMQSAEADEDYAKKDLSRKRGAFNSSGGLAVSKAALEESESALSVCAAKTKDARKAYELAVAGPRIEDIKEAEAQLKALEAELERENYVLRESVLRAPAGGVIRSRLLEPGDMATPQTPLFRIALNDKKWVRAYVQEADLGKIKEGMPADLYIDSRPDDPVRGQIGYISSTAEFTPKTVQTEELRTSLLYEIRVYLDDKENILRMGMPVTVQIRL